jgi:YD repeat-containing protein
MSSVVTANDGKQFDLDNVEQTFGYDGNGNLTTITVEVAGNTYVQTFTYTGSNLTNISGWIKQ